MGSRLDRGSFGKISIRCANLYKVFCLPRESRYCLDSVGMVGSERSKSVSDMDLRYESAS